MQPPASAVLIDFCRQSGRQKRHFVLVAPSVDQGTTDIGN
jgi:hypothetical protein